MLLVSADRSFPAYAYNNTLVHPYITTEASLLFSYSELERYIVYVIAGSINEDVGGREDHIKGRSSICVKTEHFWDPDLGEDSPGYTTFPITLGGRSIVCAEPIWNAWQRARRYWEMA
jgi:hypothetical protein